MNVGDYEGLQQIGAGAFGVTYKATHKTTGKVVALKKLELGGLPEWKPVERFEREAKVLRSLDHPSIVRFIEAFEETDDGAHAFYIVFDYVEGQTLGERIEAGHRWDEASAARLLESLLEALVYMHGLSPRVVHRDIKPGNVILTENDRPVLIDFGSVSDVSPRADGGLTIAGTAGYMAPEQAMGTVDPRADLYGLGATMVHALTHVHPSELPREGLSIVLDERTGCSEDLLCVLAGMLEPDPADRFESAEETLEALRGAPAKPTALAPRESAALATGPRALTPAAADILTIKRALSSKGPGVILGPMVLGMILTIAGTALAPASFLHIAALALFPILVFGAMGWQRTQSRRLYTDGVAVTGQVTGLHSSKESTRVTYTFRAEGHDYEGTLGTHDLLAVRELDHGSAVTVFHDPDNPAVNVALLPRELATIGLTAPRAALPDEA